jgi:hypothetical protein
LGGFIVQRMGLIKMPDNAVEELVLQAVEAQLRPSKLAETGGQRRRME